MWDDSNKENLTTMMPTTAVGTTKKRLICYSENAAARMFTSFMECDEVTSPGIMPSPSPSPVFMDDDSRDSGYCSSQGRYDTDSDSKRTKSLFQHSSFASLKVWCEEQENEIEAEFKFGDHVNCSNNNDDSPFAALKTWREEKLKHRGGGLRLRNTNLPPEQQQQESPFTSLKVPNAHHTNHHHHPYNRCRSESEVVAGECTIQRAVQKADENRSLIGDFSNGHALPLLKNPVIPDLKCVSAQTVSDILDHKFDDIIGNFALIDCRYPYEYVGGHIRSAVNLYTQDNMKEFLAKDQTLKNTSGGSNNCTNNNFIRTNSGNSSTCPDFSHIRTTPPTTNNYSQHRENDDDDDVVMGSCNKKRISNRCDTTTMKKDVKTKKVQVKENFQVQQQPPQRQSENFSDHDESMREPENHDDDDDQDSTAIASIIENHHFQQQNHSKANNKRNVLFFYCEFSKERGPRMCRFLRAYDRKQNEYRYPCLDYPEIYLIEGGYKNFYAHFKHHCEPQTYKPMDHADHADDLRKFRIKSKSWSSFGAMASVAKRGLFN